jgi:hypothetical protein
MDRNFPLSTPRQWFGLPVLQLAQPWTIGFTNIAMPTDLIQPATSLGVAGFAIYIMWKMYQASAEERKRNDERMDAKDAVQRARLDVKDEEFRKLNEQVRTDISAQLAASTSALGSNAKIMERVIDKLSK